MEGLVYGGAYLWREICVSKSIGLAFGSNFTVLALFYFVFEGNFPSTSSSGGLYLEGDLTEGFLRYRFGGLIFGGVYTWRGVFSEFYGSSTKKVSTYCVCRLSCFK